MWNNILATIVVTLNCALAMTALPSNANSEPKTSPHNVAARDAAKLGINCRGSSSCSSSSNLYDMRLFLQLIDNNTEFVSGQQAACRQFDPFNSSGGLGGLCVFPQKLLATEKVTGKDLKEAVSALIDHGCKRCGSTPIHSGEITVNYVTKPCGYGPCP
ncbi:killer toxin Kp4/SMK [Ampelomyces quisqualis]|uniref:Killer toxin Kp4/SMK n=1 Tax=Ampelomyces quisqualis TaxID=50730 RepID=A0A6A5QHD7_AMPQU|nr:killer toxin Kp4/SMK [Ampelomyces quisqualis]